MTRNRMPWDTTTCYEPMPLPSTPYRVRRRRAWVKAFWVGCAIFAATICLVALGHIAGAVVEFFMNIRLSTDG